MVLAELLDGVQVVKLVNLFFGKMALTQDISINTIQYDSRKVGKDSLFVAIAGAAADGHRFIKEAIDRGAAAVVLQNDDALPDPYFIHANVFKILVRDSRVALARMAANYYGHPSRALTLLGVTGTNGKTTTTHLLRSILRAEGRRTGLLGTIGYMVEDRMIPATHTTPESLELNALLRMMVQEHCSAAVMEVSSHSLALSRVHALCFSGAVFTNLTQDHLDFHGTMDDYFLAKKRLFDMLEAGSWAVTNADDPRGRAIAANTCARVVTYGLRSRADVTAGEVRMDVRGITMRITAFGESCEVRSQLTGRFNVENILAAYAAGAALGIPSETLREGIRTLGAVRGRFEQIASPAGWTAVIDYAHTPDALEKCLRTVRDLLPEGGAGRIITVFGCGGDRDRTKRPIMGRIAAELSDITFVTSDNPRTEDPDRIIDEILTGMPSASGIERITDRRTAIGAALARARAGDIVLIAGKGHEDYQVIGKEKLYFDDRAEVLAHLH